MSREGTTLYCGDNCDHTGPHNYPPAGVATAIAVAHRHRWTFDRHEALIGFIYHCDDHDPPLVRVVFPVDLYATPPGEDR